jgi:hypothetical protein
MSEIGDDLIEARDFVNSTIASMDLLLSDARLNIELAQSKLRDIELDAKTLRAKGISRAAKAVLTCYESGHSQPKIDGRLMTLYKLVAQYAEGLNEIAPVVTEETIQEERRELEDRHAKARETLIPLIPLAGDSAAALKRLAGLSADITIRASEPHVSFESLMPDITNSALRTARNQGKSVSLSYAADGLALANSQVETVREQLEDIVTRLISTQIATPSRRISKGLSRGGHIDISAQETAEGLDISVECDGKTVSLFPSMKEVKAETQSSTRMSMEIGA